MLTEFEVTRSFKPSQILKFSEVKPSDTWKLETVQDFFYQVGHQTTNASIKNKHFLLNNDLVRLTNIMNNLVKDLKILSFKVILQCLKLVESSQKKFFENNI